MALVAVTVSGILKDAGGSLLTSEDLIFTATDVFGDGGTVVPREPVTVTTHATTAAFSVALYTTDGASTYVRYKVRFPNGNRKTFDLTDDDLTVDLDALINAYDGTAGASGSVSLAALEASVANVFNIKAYGALVDGTTDDSAAVQLAMNAVLTAGGGTVYFPSGITRIESASTVNMLGEQGTILFAGNGGDSVIYLAGGSVEDGVSPIAGTLTPTTPPTTVAFTVQNCPKWTIRDLTVMGTFGTNGTAPHTYDVQQAVFFGSTVEQMKVENCTFLGISINAPYDDGPDYDLNDYYGIVVASGSDLLIDNCYFGGCATNQCPNVGVTEWDALTIRDTQFIDYGYYRGTTVSKTTVTNTWWVRAINNNSVTSARQRGKVQIDRVKFDEANNSAVMVYGGEWVEINNVSANVGLYFALNLLNIKQVTIKDTFVGYTNFAGGVNLHGCDDVELDGLKFGGTVTHVTTAEATKRVKLRNTRGVSVTNTAASFIDADFAMPSTASAAALAPLGKRTHVTGTTSITSITTTNLRAGDEITLIFDSTATLTDGNNIKAAGNLVATADDTWTGIFDGTNVYETCRSVN